MARDGTGEGITEVTAIARKRWFDATPVGKEGVTERYVVFGESRRWLVNQMDLQENVDVLDLGSGHGFLTYELTSRTKSRITALDLLAGEQLSDAMRGAREARVNERISWTVGDARASPFRDGSSDAVVSFLALQDIHMIGGSNALSRVVQESCRLLKSGGMLLFADNMFPESVHTGAQRLYWTLQSKEFQAGLPSKKVLLNLLHENGMSDLRERGYEPDIGLDEKEARVELLDVIEAKPFGKVIDFGSLWKRYGERIGRIGLAYPRVLSVTAYKREQQSGRMDPTLAKGEDIKVSSYEAHPVCSQAFLTFIS